MSEESREINWFLALARYHLAQAEEAMVQSGETVERLERLREVMSSMVMLMKGDRDD